MFTLELHIYLIPATSLRDIKQDMHRNSNTSSLYKFNLNVKVQTNIHFLQNLYHNQIHNQSKQLTPNSSETLGK